MDTQSTILVVDDEREIASLMRDFLEAEGFRVLTATDGDTALTLLEDAQVNCLLLDVMMPGLSGFELCRRIRAARNVPILFLSARDAVTFRLDDPGAPCYVDADPHLVIRAMENLLDNALRYTPPDSVIDVTWHQSRERVRFTIKDQGPGIAAHDLPHLFTPLYRGESSRNRRTGGAGLGLAISRRILQAYGGDLTAANDAAAGAVFHAVIPTSRRM